MAEDDDFYYNDWDDNALFQVPLTDQDMAAWDNGNDPNDDDDGMPIDHLLDTTEHDLQATSADANEGPSSQTLRSRLAGPSTNKVCKLYDNRATRLN